MSIFPREMDATVTSDLLASAVSILSLPQPIAKVQGILALQGMGEVSRVTQAIEWWERPDCQANWLLVPGTNLAERTADSLSLERLQKQPYSLHRTEGVLVKAHEENTLTQMTWIVEKIEEHAISTLALFTAPYHMVRSYLTLICQLRKRGMEVVVIPMPVQRSLGCEVPETSLTGWQMIPGETSRVPNYQAKGDVATFQELQEYLAWVWQQPIMY